MLNLKMAMVAGISVLALTTTTESAFAQVASKAESNNHIIFEAGNSITDPVDPTDPGNPNPPNPVDPTDPENPGTGNEGPLSIDYVSNIEFGTNKISSKAIVYNAKNENPFVQVTDNRGTGAGWTLTAKATAFQSKDGSKVLKGAELSFKNGTLKTLPDNISEAPMNQDVTFVNSDAQVVMTAKENTGRGTWINVYDDTLNNNQKVQLKVLPGTADVDTDYTAKIDWELTDAPM
ncbi:WxL domain-containing protein [Listeria booriae]|uniref:WxL domain-containing protein n=1 Tax=Listeria booriae TaxID=1552123 RepID=UPI0016283913|nr:WxL domain-containing protein [Listeria booriae]MBC1975262.1 WxL domain-containing protein [Listeria booriae]MBC2021590.1 WxL domain-containing protein [Listeria booriae]MBC2023718.1 WxL domain-containing protein [Listeria booriae]MBC2033061.1 WxL domain-containing protein [Listeria booriae]MBC2057631.1 WxL domain-containing protein [Listeria booriae]